MEEQRSEWVLTPGKAVSAIVFTVCLVDLVLAANTGYTSVHEYYGLDIPGPDAAYDGALLALSSVYVALGKNPKK
tara:strand:+ start:2917 stop:3141 length:225 start_codon:yes stop_codon:yes gene_type:complete